MANRKIISISGEMQVGKDEFAKPLILSGFKRASFAGNLKLMCQSIFNLTDIQTDTQEGKKEKLKDVQFTPDKLDAIIQWVNKTHKVAEEKIAEIHRIYIQEQLRAHGSYRQLSTPREVLQFVGTEVIRNINENYHVEVLVTFLENDEKNSYVICDARFLNEVEILKNKFNAHTIRIKRPNYSDINKSNHLSEQIPSDNNFDLVINNDGTIEDLHEKALKIIA